MCAIVGLLHTNSRPSFQLPVDAYRVLSALQHRGQDASGLVSWNKETQSFNQFKDIGLANEIYDEQKLLNLSGNIIIGHNRYATIGSDNVEDLQPLVSGFPRGISLAHNGNLVNYHALKERILSSLSVQLLTNNDAECFLSLFNYYYLENNKIDKLSFFHLESIFTKIIHEVEGAYSLVMSIAGKGLIGLRDPHGIRPLVLGKKLVEDNTIYCLCSESSGLNFSGFTFVRDIEPGELIFIDLQGNIHSSILKKEVTAQCMFEWVYFAGAESSINGLSVYSARLNLGLELSKQLNELILNKVIDPDIVSPVPDTSRTAAISISEKLNVPYRESLLKNRYVQRSFILNTQEKREKAIDLKLIPIKSEIEGKNILLVDDSIVRGTTSKKIIKLLKDNGAKNVYLAITCPPIRHSCFYGIDFPDSEDLIAGADSIEQIRQRIGADSLIYLDIFGLKNALDDQGLCTGCLDNIYPTKGEDRDEFARLRKSYKEKEVFHEAP